MDCPKCKKPMVNHGNISGIILTSYPPQWTEVWVCENCKVYKIEHCRGESIGQINLADYEEI